MEYSSNFGRVKYLIVEIPACDIPHLRVSCPGPGDLSKNAGIRSRQRRRRHDAWNVACKPGPVGGLGSGGRTWQFSAAGFDLA